MSAEDLERYETEIELQLYREYRDVLPMFSYVVETERRFYLTNSVKLDVRTEDGQIYFELELQRRLGVGHVPPGALRRQRPGRDVQGRQHRGARQGRLTWPTAADRSGWPARTPSRAGTRARATTVLDRNWRCREGELDLVVARGRAVVFCEVKTRRGTAFGAPVEAVTLTKQRRLRTLALRWLSRAPEHRAPELRFDVASVLAAPRRRARDRRDRSRVLS